MLVGSQKVFESAHQFLSQPHPAEAGAIEFLTKPFRDDVLLNAVRGAIERSRDALRHDSEMQRLRERYASLTSREREVMVLVVSGLLNKQVGGELGIGEITVKAHTVCHLMHKGRSTPSSNRSDVPHLM